MRQHGNLQGFLKRHPVGTILALVFAAYFVTRLVSIRSVPIYIDEAIYLKWSRDALHGNLWASLLWDGKPPLHAWSMVPFLRLLKDPLLAGRLTSVFSGALTTLGMFLLGKEFMNRKFGLLAAVLYVACPYALFYDRLAIAESLLLALFVFAIYFAVKAAKSVNSYYLIGAGVATGLALLTKGTAALIYPILGFAYVTRSHAEKGREKGRPLLRWSAALALSLLLAFAIENLLRLSPRFAERSHFIATRTKSLSAALATPAKQFLAFNVSILDNMFKFLTPVVLVLALLGLFLGIKNKWRPTYFLWIWLLIGAGVISLVGRFAWSRFYLVLVPPLLLSAAYIIYGLGASLARAWKGGSVAARKLTAAAVASTMALVLVAGTAQVSSLEKGMITARQGDLSFLSGRTAGVGMPETVRFLDEASRSQRVNVVVNDYFVQLVLELYLGDDPNLNVITLELEYRKGFSDLLRATIDKAAASGPTYVVINGLDVVPGTWPLAVLREFRKDIRRDDSCMFIARATTRSISTSAKR
jgi:4-amino-4-deoxy-L-arabinose transferase-like glycosyltransferase